MSEHNLILEFYKPTYNLDFDYDGNGGLDLHFTNIKGEFFMTMNDSYNSVYIEDEDCEFSKGEMFATVDLGDLVERIINGEFRQTNGKAINDWSKRFIGDGEEQIEFNGKNYADGSLFWNDFFKEMPKDEIKDFMTFCEDYLDLPNIEVDTVSDKYDFENGKVELKSNGKWSITLNDDYTIISVDKFTCNSTDACDAYYVASSESDEDDFYESKKSARKSLKEGINDELIATSSDGETTLYLSDERQANHGKDPHYEFKLGENGYFTRYIRCDDIRCENVVLDWIKEFDLDISKSEISKIIKLHESKKSVKKSLKESVDGHIATDEDCNMSGKGWVLDGSYNFIMEFLQEWGIAPKDVKVKNGMTTLFNADGNPFGYVYQDEEVDIFVADKTINWTWENHNPSTKRVKVTALDEIF